MKSSAREQLSEQVREARRLLAERAPYYTDADKEALEVMTDRAERALEGKNDVPFTRNREFYVPREEEQIEFARLRYSKAPSYLREPARGVYGLEEALRWMKTRDVLRMGKSEMHDRARYLMKTVETTLGGTNAGSRVGEYSPACRGRLYRCLDDLRDKIDCDPETLGKAIIGLENAMRDYRDSRILLCDVEPDINLYLTEQEMERLKKSLDKDPLLRNQVRKMKEIADRYSLEDIEAAYADSQSDEDHYEDLNQRFYMWSYTDRIANFFAPENAATANISFVLPAEENEEDGLGHVWIDDVEVISASGSNMAIRNPGFEDGDGAPDGWQFQSRKGNAKMRWEDRYPFCGEQKRSIYIENPTAQDEGAWVHDTVYEVDGGSGYTLTFWAKLDGKLKKGLKTVISFWDEAGNPLEEFVYYFNRKSYLLPPVCFALEMQCDAIMYALTGDKTYARKAKTEMLFVANDFCQGVEYWLVYDMRPEGCDAYGAVQGGRILSSLACTYMFIRNAGVFTPGETDILYKRISYILDDMLDLRDRTQLTVEEALRWSGNWHTDMCTGTLLFMLVAPDYPEYRKTWLYNGYYILKNQLIQFINEDGSWPESIRYHFAALMRFGCDARIVKHMMGEDWFEETDLPKMFTYALEMQTPAYAYMDGRIATPPFGDHRLNSGEDFAIFGIYVDVMKDRNKYTADKMYATWELAGKPVPELGKERIAFENLLICGSGYELDPGFRLYLNSTKSYPDSGIYIFRKDYGTPEQSYFAIMSSPKWIGHGHLDQGSFLIYKDSVPIVMDSAIEGYFDTSTEWHLSSYSHACVLFQNRQEVEKRKDSYIDLSAGNYSRERGWCDTPVSSKVLECTTEGHIKSITVEIQNTGGPGTHIRKVVYIKPDDIYIIYDKIVGFEGNILFSLPVVSSESVINGNHIVSKCHYGLELETTFLSQTQSIRLDRGRTWSLAPDQTDLEYIRAAADASDGFLTILEPRKQGGERGYTYRRRDGYLIVETRSGEEALILF